MLKWTKQFPKKDGTYWWRLNSEYNAITRSVVRNVTSGVWYEEGWWLIRRVLDEGEWLGPITYETVFNATDLAADRIKTLLEATRLVCMYCSGNARGYEPAVGPNEAGNYTHKDLTSQTGHLVLCKATSIHSQISWDANGLKTLGTEKHLEYLTPRFGKLVKM
jgi:hypothetical protein